MVNPVSQEEMRLQMTQMEDRLAHLEAKTADPSIDRSTKLAELSEIEDLQEALNPLEMSTFQVSETARDILPGLATISQRLEELKACRFSLLTAQGSLDSETFVMKLSMISHDQERLVAELAMSKPNLHEAAKEIESTLIDRVSELLADATVEQTVQVNELLAKVEELHVRYFSQTWSSMESTLTGNNPSTDFNRVLPFANSVCEFISKHRFVSEHNKKQMHTRTLEILGTLDKIISAQKTHEATQKVDVEEISSDFHFRLALLDAIKHQNIVKSDEALKGMFPLVTEKVKNQFLLKLDQLLSAANERPLNPGSRKDLCLGKKSMTSYATKEQCREAIEAAFPVELPKESALAHMEEQLDGIYRFLRAEGLLETEIPAQEAAPSSLDEDLEFAQAIALSEEIATPSI